MRNLILTITLSLIALTGFAQQTGRSEITHWNLLTDGGWSPEDYYTSNSYLTTEGSTLTVYLENVGVMEIEVFGNPIRSEEGDFRTTTFQTTRGDRVAFLVHKESGSRAVSLMFTVTKSIILLYLGDEHIISPVSLLERSGI